MTECLDTSVDNSDVTVDSFDVTVDSFDATVDSLDATVDCSDATVDRSGDDEIRRVSNVPRTMTIRVESPEELSNVMTSARLMSSSTYSDEYALCDASLEFDILDPCLKL